MSHIKNSKGERCKVILDSLFHQNKIGEQLTIECPKLHKFVFHAEGQGLNTTKL